MAERIQDYSEPVTGMHIKDIATISCIVRLNTITVLVVMSHSVCVLSKHGTLITIYLLIIRYLYLFGTLSPLFGHIYIWSGYTLC